LKRYGGERQLTNWQHLCELIIAASAENGSIESILNWMEEQKAAQREENEQRLETDAEAVQLVTIHGSKGLEYPFVFCPSLWTYRFDHDKKPDFFMCSRKGDPLGLRQLHFCKDSDSYEHNMPLHHLDRLREHLRLIYVALTRAVYYCQVGGADDKNSSPSASMQWLWAPSSTPLGAKMQAGPDFQHQLQGWCQHQGHDFITQDDCDGHPKVLRRDRGEVPLREPAPLVIHQANRTVASFSALTKHDSGAVHLSAHGPEQEEAELGSIHDFPRGAQVGDCLHYILEHTYFGQPEQQEALVRSSLRRHRLDIDGAGVDVMEQRSALLLDQLNHVAQADLGGFCLGEIDHRLVLAEMEFTFSLGYATPKSLAKIFREHGSSALVREYAERIDRLGFKSVQGHLTGFIDFCFVHHDRAYIIDWKSNHLGPNAMAYEELGTVMASHHYILQYHLYALALHLHLSKNWPDDAYHYETHFAKVIYPFLRGVQKQTDRGLYMDRPSFAMIQALEALLIPSSADFAHNDVEVLR
jgi:exodeoxyribonuclease V beta subunit